MNKNIIAVFIIILSFVFGFALGKKNAKIVNIGLPQPVYRETKEPRDKQPVLIKNYELENKRSSFYSLTTKYAERLKDLQSKLAQAENAANSLYSKTEDEENAPSIEASMVYEIQYRDALTLLATIQRQLIVLYDSKLQNDLDYINFLESIVSKEYQLK